MGSFIAIATDKDGKSIWNGHFGVSPIYSIFDENGNLVKQIKNPYSDDKHHDNPSLIVNLLNDISVFIARNMGKKSRERLAKTLGVKSILVNAKDIYEAINYYLEVKKNIDVFERCTEKYENWFDKYKAIYESELNMLKALTTKFTRALEIGVGSGRFAYPLGIKEGIEPSIKMAEIAKQRDIKVYPGFAESLPFQDEEFDFVLLAVTICFVRDPVKTLKEAHRILKKNGNILVAIVDRNSQIGKEYLHKKEKGKFYKNATFFSTDEVCYMLENAGFDVAKIYQTLLSNSLKEIDKPQDFKEGYGLGGFVGILGIKL